jgi:hypothetical protein
MQPAGARRGNLTCAQRPHLMEIVERELSAVQIKGRFGVVLLLLLLLLMLLLLLLLELHMLAGGGGEPPRLQGIEARSAHAGGR